MEEHCISAEEMQCFSFNAFLFLVLQLFSVFKATGFPLWIFKINLNNEQTFRHN
jgi:hypothetical protein